MDAFQQMASLASNQIPQNYQDSPEQHDPGSAKRKADDGQPQQRAKRNRYISIACNECKRRKIKCNGQTPCQRCGNLNLECVYAPNCCNGFKDSQEYREMTAVVASLQDQVNSLYNDLNSLRAQINHGPTPPLQQQQQLIQPPPPPQPHQHTPIDPSLQSYSAHRPSFSGQHGSPPAPVSSMSPNSARMRRQSFRGPTSAEFNFGVAKSSLQTMGITGQNDNVDDGSGFGGIGTAEGSPVGSPNARDRAQLLQSYHSDKDPIWQISQEEALRLCQIYEDEMGLMYPLLDIGNVTAYATNLYRFMEAAHRAGLMQKGFPGADSIDDEDTNILKMVLATALTVEASGNSELGQRIFDFVQPAVDNLLLGNVGIKGIRLLAMTAMFEFHRDNEGTAWRIIGLTARLCIELGLHRRETYDALQSEAERTETILLFWSIYVLDRRWSFGTGMPFALQDGDIDPQLPKPEDRSPYLSAMIQYCTIGSKVWKSIAANASTSDPAGIKTDEMNYLDYQIVQWLQNIPAHLKFDHPSQKNADSSTSLEPTSSRAGHRLKILLYVRANQMRILLYRPVLHSATSIMQHRKSAETVVDIAKDTIRVITNINQTSDLYKTQQVLFNAFLASALAVLFLAVSHTPVLFAENVREEFYMALELVRGFSKGSWIAKRLWKTIRVLKEVGPKLGLKADTSSSQKPGDGELDPSRSAAVAMAGLAGHNVDERALYTNGNGTSNHWSIGSNSSTSPEGMANDLTSLFEAAGGLQAIGNSDMNGDAINGGVFNSSNGMHENGNGVFIDEGLSQILKELF
ncbi:Hypothetical protein R9X50_00231100 [Acrodontium crateriforme]|uniref:Zn(2)-C6 fungal-type domain-containing protein n=1 Tax=Acrodontium crateriforme TaxID=150365 RepID=A0AAQ3M1Z9_9PEZI|nr:Hypothetical protein R9X50_00231100 [Acrodontium crateriforme]